ncbi:hypothetical protein LJC47_05750, partial [Desulfosarcina sp. OttesenSCG-928-B08]|nr:hypothetical protein [Desulfosarcina sp. OttesenSCG-928-B08]
EAGLKQETGLTVQVDRKLSQVHHAYTHFTLSADVYLCRYETGRVRLREAVAHQWVTFSGLERLPVHRAQQKFFPVLAKAMGRE